VILQVVRYAFTVFGDRPMSRLEITLEQRISVRYQMKEDVAATAPG
jgi:hypothetical protein